MARIPGALFLSVLLSTIALAQNPPAQKTVTTKTPGVSMPMVAPVFLEDAEFSSTLTLVNDAIRDFKARVLVLDQHGIAAAQKELLLPGHTNLPVRIHDLLEESGSAITTGSVIVIPEPVPGMPIAGQLSITSHIGSAPSYIEEELLMPDEKTTPGMYRASALAVQGSPIIALKSLAQSTQTVTLECYSEKTAPTKGTLQLASGESILVAACDVSQTGRAAISEAVSDNPAVNRGSVGVSITTTAPSGDLIGYGFAAYRDDRGPYFTSLNLTDPAAMRSSRTIFTGIPAGPADLFPRESFQPELAISNFSNQSAAVSVTMATTTAGRTKTDVVQKLAIGPKSSRTVKLPAQGDAGMKNSLVVRSSLSPGDLVSQFIAWGDVLVRAVEMQSKDNDAVENGGGHPWTIEDGTDSTLLWFNHTTDGPKKFEIFIGNGKQTWRNSYQLAPMETKAISINEIVEKQVPDAKGVFLSKDIRTGQVGWWTDRAGWGKGRLMVSQPRTGLSRSFSCSNCAVLCPTVTLDPTTSAAFGVNFFGDLGDAIAQQCVITCNTGCGGSPVTDTGATFTWSSQNTQVTTLYSGQNTSKATYKGVAAGVTNGLVQATSSGQQCVAHGGGSVTVKPTITSISPAQGLVGTAESVTITGTGFSSGATISAGSNISVANVSIKSSTQITATFTPKNATSAGGNQSVTVTAGGWPSNPTDFYVQVPTHFQRADVPGAPGGLGPVTPVTNGNVVDLTGKILATNYCGVYENFAYEFTDQQSKSLLNGTGTVTEVFSNIKVPPGPTPSVNTVNFANEANDDNQAWGHTYPTCLGNNDNQAFDYSYTVKIGTVTYSLVTVVHYTKGNFNGTLNVTSTITTP